MPISIPVIDMVEIGAGGGSLARVDGMQQIRVGPESAGSEPGPACYGRGGVRPAVTDADLILGKLDPDNFAGGSIPLQVDAAAFALDQALGQPLGMPTIEAAWGLAEVVDENMANAARVHAVENGEDLSTYTMIAFGGAAPLHAGRLCEKLGVARCLIPQGAGVGSAIGFLRAPFSFESNRTHFMPHAGFDPQAVRDLFADMVAEATRFVRTCAPDAPILADFKVYMRYKGQGWEIPVPLTPAQAEQADPAVFLARFEQEYTTLFGRTVAGMAVEITVWSVNAYTATAAVDALPLVTAQPAPTPSGQRQLFDAALGRAQDAGIYDRAALPRGTALQGPALITEEETTTVLPLSRQARILGDGSIDITVQGG